MSRRAAAVRASAFWGFVLGSAIVAAWWHHVALAISVGIWLAITVIALRMAPDEGDDGLWVPPELDDEEDEEP